MTVEMDGNLTFREREANMLAYESWFEENRERMERDGADVDALKAGAVEAAEAKTMLTRFAEFVLER